MLQQRVAKSFFKIYLHILDQQSPHYLFYWSMNSTFKVFLLVVLLIAFQVKATSHFLSNFENDFKQMTSAYHSKDTSRAFSIAMKVFTSVQILVNEADVSTESQLNLEFSNQNCSSLLHDVVLLGSQSNWAQMYETLHLKMRALQASCTNRDFDYGPQGSSNGLDDKCALCVIVLQVFQNYISIHKKDITAYALQEFCGLFDGVVRPTCEAFIHYAGPSIIEAIVKKQNSDVTCLKIGFCTNPQCRITKSKMELYASELKIDNKPAPWQWLVELFTKKFGDRHLPPFDLDNDTFGDVSTFRGYHWRGADCNEFNKNFYPGRKTGEQILDHDCNGVFGISPKGRTYEDEFCSHSKRFGVAVIGDSAGAHFSIPEKYFNASMINKTTYHDLLSKAADELDIPHESGYTGNTKTVGYTRHSVYKFAREWNLCNHNDYQNIAVNGGDSGNTQGNIHALSRNQQHDHPLLMFMELVGNDVCSKSFDGMTTTTQFKANILKLLNHLDSTVPAGSHLMILGLADGQLLYDNLHDWTHPLNVTYADVYDFLNCLKISPCWGWLNTNETVRRFTTQRAQNLSKVYQQIIDQGYKFKNFDVVYYDFPAMEILQRKVIEGGDAKQMIERCDGFHPNGEFHSDLADWLWNKIQTNHPEWVGPKNPYNEKIRKVFGHEVYN